MNITLKNKFDGFITKDVTTVNDYEPQYRDVFVHDYSFEWEHQMSNEDVETLIRCTDVMMPKVNRHSRAYMKLLTLIKETLDDFEIESEEEATDISGLTDKALLKAFMKNQKKFKECFKSSDFIEFMSEEYYSEGQNEFEREYLL